MDIEALQHLFRPENVTIFFVGESPPANGTFFCDEISSGCTS